MSIILGLLGAAVMTKKVVSNKIENEKWKDIDHTYYRNQRLRMQDRADGMSIEMINAYTRAGRYKLPDVPYGMEDKIDMEKYKRDIEVKGFQRAFDACVNGEYDLEKEEVKKAEEEFKKWQEETQRIVDEAKENGMWIAKKGAEFALSRGYDLEYVEATYGKNLGNKWRREHGMPEID